MITLILLHVISVVHRPIHRPIRGSEELTGTTFTDMQPLTGLSCAIPNILATSTTTYHLRCVIVFCAVRTAILIVMLSRLHLPMVRLQMLRGIRSCGMNCTAMTFLKCGKHWLSLALPTRVRGPLVMLLLIKHSIQIQTLTDKVIKYVVGPPSARFKKWGKAEQFHCNSILRTSRSTTCTKSSSQPINTGCSVLLTALAFSRTLLNS